MSNEDVIARNDTASAFVWEYEFERSLVYTFLQEILSLVKHFRVPKSSCSSLIIHGLPSLRIDLRTSSNCFVYILKTLLQLGQRPFNLEIMRTTLSITTSLEW